MLSRTTIITDRTRDETLLPVGLRDIPPDHISAEVNLRDLEPEVVTKDVIEE